MNTIIYLASVIAFVGVAAGSVPHTQYRPLGRPLVSKAEAESKASGLCFQVNSVICSKDCTQLFLCVQDEGTWDLIMIETCDAGKYCDSANRGCSDILSSCSPTDPAVFQLQCTATGNFPDPYDCTVYHECSTIAQPSKVLACQSGWSYNSMTTECDHSLSAGLCFPKGVIPACTQAGESGPVPENHNIYFICLKSAAGTLVHELYKCAHGGQYNNGVCTAPPP